VQPETEYAHSGDVSIAYQVLGDGPIDLIYAPGAVSNVEYSWHIPAMGAWWRRLAQFSRLIAFDKRGTGLSDRASGMPTLEERIDDMRAVMDAAGSDRAVLFGESDGAAMAALFAATYPARTIGLILYGAEARWSWAPDYPWGSHSGPRTPEAREELRQAWGTREFARQDLERFAPSVVGDPELERLWASWIRFSCTPADLEAYIAMGMETDVRHVLPTIAVPTLVLHRTEDRVVDVEAGRYTADRIPGARWVELPGEDHLGWWGDSEALAVEMERFVGELGAEVRFDRVLATVLFTDIVGSTEKAVELGDRGWHDLVERHHAVVRGQLGRFRGREIDTAGDGFFASFDGPARAIRCACAIREAVRDLGLEIRAGLHTGEVELADGRPRGIAVHIGARVAAKAEPGEVLVSNTVKDLVAGSGIDFDDCGSAELKGVPGEWRLYAVRS
jgi:pimeloyl-ACP methyl ester carboxylesterase